MPISMGAINFLVPARVRFSFLNQSVIAKRAAGLQELSGRSKELLAALIVRNGFHRPENVKLILEVHGLGVHDEELRIELLSCRSLDCHFGLNWRNGYAGDGGVIVLRQIKTAASIAAANVQNLPPRSYLCEFREMLDELKLGLFF